MARRAKIALVEPTIVKYFDSLQTRVFTTEQLRQIFEEHHKEWELPASTSFSKFVRHLTDKVNLQTVILRFPNRKFTRFMWKEANNYEVTLSINPGGYLSHYTAMSIHNLTDQIPQVIYFNIEQKQTTINDKAELSQEKMDAAFKKQVRVSHEIARYNDLQICILHGKNTNKLGVRNITDSQREIARVTDIERTLIDITVRPAYSGGVFQVLEAYKRAKDKVSINRLTAILQKLDYTYPYHQSIGFYLTRAGVYKKSIIDLLRKFPIEYDFYLQHNIPNTNYCSEWRLYIPKGF